MANEEIENTTTRRRRPIATTVDSQEASPSVKYEDAPDDLFVVEKTYSEAEKDLIEFVEKKISQMQQNLLFEGDVVVQFPKLNEALMNYESVTLGLLSLHQEARFKSQIAQENYDNFYAIKYVEIKNEQASLAKDQKITAAREIEMLVRQRNMVELSKLKAKVIEAENEYNMMNHLVESWKNYQYVLGTLSRNAQAEAAANGIALKNPKEFGDEAM